MSGLGNQLKEARERMRVTVTEAAAATHLKILVIDAMERDDYRRLIAPAYAKGFFRLYCEYLGLNAEPFIEAYLHSSGVSEDKAELIRDPKKKPGLFSGLQKRMKEMQERKEIQRKAQEIAAAQEKAKQLGARPRRVAGGQQELRTEEPVEQPEEIAATLPEPAEPEFIAPEPVVEVVPVEEEPEPEVHVVQAVAPPFSMSSAFRRSPWMSPLSGRRGAGEPRRRWR
jgi:cytoskeletal protein RodZ